MMSDGFSSPRTPSSGLGGGRTTPGAKLVSLSLQSMGTTCNLYALSNYSFGSKKETKIKDRTVEERFKRIEEIYNKEGLRTTVGGVLLVHNHGHPHILLLQQGDSHFLLPGGRLRPGESEVDGLKRKLTSKLAPVDSDEPPELEIGELISTWWRPNFESMVYPYKVPHVTRPKECIKLFMVYLPETCVFAVPTNLKLLAVPLFELYENKLKYGPIISSLPQMLSRFSFSCI